MRSLFVIGDSISCYYGRYLSPLLEGVLRYERKGGTHILQDLDDGTDGVNGGHSGMVLAYLRERIRRGGFSPDLLLLNCGLHDMKKTAAGVYQVPPPAYAQNLESILALGDSIGCRWVWARTTPVNPSPQSRAARQNLPPEALAVRDEEDVPRYNEIADGVMRAHGVPRIDLYRFTRNLGSDIYLTDADPVHFDKATAAKQAAFVAGALGVL